MIVKHAGTLAARELERLAQLQSRVGIGWLRFSDDAAHWQHWQDIISEIWNIKFRPRGKGWQGYTDSIQTGFGIILAMTPYLTQAQREELGVKPSPNEGRMTVDIPQSAMDALQGDDLLKLLTHIAGCDHTKFTRLDLYHDDYCKIISPEAVDYALSRGGVAAPRQRNHMLIRSRDHQKGIGTGATLYLGSTKSGKQLRFYDKAAESNGKIDCYRWEMEYTQEYAKVAGNLLIEALEKAYETDSIDSAVTCIENVMKSIIGGSISFHDIPPGMAPAELGRNWADRTPLTWWWKEILAGLKPAKLTLNKRRPSLEGKIAWVKNQVAPSLALVRTAFSHWRMSWRCWLEELLELGEEKWSAKHLDLLEESLVSSPAY